MKRIALLATLLALPLAAQAEPQAQLKPMSFLAGHCWKATFPDGKQTDEHCFEWMYGGHYLRDRHTVKAPGQPDYQGETLYYWDPAAKAVSYLYVENHGGLSRGTAELQADKFVFPEAKYMDGEQVLPYRAQWTRKGDDAYEAHNEISPAPGKWMTQFKLTMVKQK